MLPPRRVAFGVGVWALESPAPLRPGRRLLLGQLLFYDGEGLLGATRAIKGRAAAEGGDYSAIGTSVVVGAGTTTATIPVTVIDDGLIEGSESVRITLIYGPGYIAGSPNSDTVNIADDDLVPYPYPYFQDRERRVKTDRKMLAGPLAAL